MRKTLLHSLGMRLVLATLMLAALAPSVAQAAEDWAFPTSDPKMKFSGGSGTSSDPYLIGSAQDLADFVYLSRSKTFKGVYFLMTRDIVLNDNVITSDLTRDAHGTIHYSDNKEHFDGLKQWTSVAYYDAISWLSSTFEGVFDGGGHSISGIYLREGGIDCDYSWHNIGLFGICKNARISNLTIKDCYYTLDSLGYIGRNGKVKLISAGAIVASAENTTITNCHVENCVIAGEADAYNMPDYHVGGIVGSLAGKTCVVSDCSYSGIVESYFEDDYVDISHLNKIIKYGSYVGGIIGYCDPSDKAVITNCHTNGTLVTNRKGQRLWRKAEAAGGIVGGIDESSKLNTTISKCSNRMDIYAFDTPDYSIYGANYIAVGGICAVDAICEDCVNFGNMKLLSPESTRIGADYKYIGYADKYYMHGICLAGKATNCINYGNITFGYIYSYRTPGTGDDIINVNLGGIMSGGGTITRCFNNSVQNLYCKQDYNKIKYAYDPISPSSSVEVIDCQDYTSVRTKPTTTTDKEYAKVKSMHEGVIEPDNSLTFTHNGRTLAKELNKKYGRAMFGTELGNTRWGTNAYNDWFSVIGVGAVAPEFAGAGTETDPYHIGTEADLRLMQQLIARDPDVYADKCYRLINSINITGTEPMSTIGAYNIPFTGHFDGKGYFIRGLNLKNGSLFFRVAKGTAEEAIGKVERLALLDVKCQSELESGYYYYGAIARYLGNNDGTGQASIEDCYVTGDIETAQDNHFTPTGGICTYIYGGSTVKNCAFWGSIAASGYENYNKVGGIAAVMSANASIKNCIAAWTYSNPKDNDQKPIIIGSVVAEKAEGATVTKSWGALNYDWEKYTNVTSNPNGATHIGNEYMLTANNLNESDTDPHWLQGRYGPVLKNAYHYDCKTPDGKDMALLPIDRMPIEIHQTSQGTGYEIGCNDILTLTPTGEQLARDTKMWQLANLAIYLENRNADYVTDLRLRYGSSNGYSVHNTQYTASMGYAPSHEGIETLGAATYKVGVKTGSNWYSLCLPGCVEKTDLPDGSKLFVGGKLADNKMNIIEVDSVPAGVPFFMHYSKADDSALGDSITIHMTGVLKATPQVASESSALKGTFAIIDGNDNLRCAVEEQADGTLRLVKSLVDKVDTEKSVWTYNVPRVPLFAAYVENAEDVVLDASLLLDENSNDIESTLNEYDGKKVKVIMNRTIRGNGWNTVCLPFGVENRTELAKVLGCGDPENIYIEKLDEIKYDESSNTLVFNFAKVEPLLGIDPGVPYLVRAYIDDKSILDFGEKKIVNTTEPIEKTVDGLDLKIAMVGSLPKVIVQSGSDENAYFLQGNTFYRATVSNPVVSPGFRCWFRVTNASGTGAALLQAARVVHGDGSTTDIRLIDGGTAPDGSRIYDMQGMGHSDMVRGVNIVGGKKIIKK